jgi:hypothetical protein
MIKLLTAAASWVWLGVWLSLSAPAQAQAQEAPTSPPVPAIVQEGPRPYGSFLMTELTGSFGLSTTSGYGGNVGIRSFLLPRVAPGLAAGYFHVAGWNEAWLLGTVRIVPVSWSRVAFAVTPFGGRVFLSNHDDGWAFGGNVSAVFAATATIGFEAGFEAVTLWPNPFCKDLESCHIYRPIVGLYFLL